MKDLTILGIFYGALMACLAYSVHTLHIHQEFSGMEVSVMGLIMATAIFVMAIIDEILS